MRAVVDRSLCVGSGWCMNLAPDDFRPDDLGKAIFVPRDDPDPELLEEAADNCPVAAIELVAD